MRGLFIWEPQLKNHIQQYGVINMDDQLIDLTLSALENSAIVVLLANILTLFIDDKKLAKAGPFISAIGKFLNLLALNVGTNKNADAQ